MSLNSKHVDEISLILGLKRNQFILNDNFILDNSVITFYNNLDNLVIVFYNN